MQAGQGIDGVIGRTFGGYRVTRFIARGGMGVVYEGVQESLDRPVAIKILYPHLSDDGAFRERFEREARSVARLNHPNIVRVLDFGADGAYHYMVMDFIDGESLRDRLARVHSEGLTLSTASIMNIVEQVGSALAYAHGLGYVHRDVKPGNVLLGKEGRVFLADFGVVKIVGDSGITAAGMIVGTPEYMAPEQSSGAGHVGAQADMYSLAIITYEMMVGRVPFKAQTPVAVMRMQMNDPPPPPSTIQPWFPAEVEQVLMTALAKEPAGRYENVAAFVTALKAAATAMRERSTGTIARLEEIGAVTPGVGPTTAGAQAAAIGAVTAAPAATSTPPAGTATPPPGGPPSPPAGTGQPVPAAGAADRRRRLPIIIAAAVALLILGGAAVYAMGGDDDGDDPTPTSELGSGNATPSTTGESQATATSAVAISNDPTATTEAAAPTPTTSEPAPTPTQETAAEATPSVPPSETPTEEPAGFAAPDGFRPVIIFSSHRGEVHDSQVYMMNPDGTDQRQLTFSRGHSWGPRVSPDGTMMFFSSVAPGEHPEHGATGGGAEGLGNHEIYVANADGSGITKITTDPAWDNAWSWSPDGQLITFTSVRDGNWELYVMRPDGTELRRLTMDPANDGWPSWTPDGEQIIFSSDRTGDEEIYIMNVDGSDLRQLTQRPDTVDTYPFVSPDGTKIVFSSQFAASNEGEIYVMNIDGSELTRLTSTIALNYAPSWSPDGQYIVFASDRDGNHNIYIMDADGSNQTRLTTDAGEDTTPAFAWVRESQ